MTCWTVLGFNTDRTVFILSMDHLSARQPGAQSANSAPGLQHLSPGALTILSLSAK
ncbi:hypothetical protein [Erwinia psidii]|uniref:hypothetical protein n=1 Tax=Erwinia psidii TaxID=69224 RepID=UPI001315836D|nr:hypothetical protein [Erwinia psidii]